MVIPKEIKGIQPGQIEDSLNSTDKNINVLTTSSVDISANLSTAFRAVVLNSGHTFVCLSLYALFNRLDSGHHFVKRKLHELKCVCQIKPEKHGTIFGCPRRKISIVKS